MEQSHDINSELESFRERWRAEVRAKRPGLKSQQAAGGADASGSSSSRPPRASAPPRQQPPSTKRGNIPDNDDDYVQAQSFEGPVEGQSPSQIQGQTSDNKGKEPVSALDHYEKAVEKEAQGSLGDSLQLYRKAFRMDNAVDKTYKIKHFPPPLAAKAGQANSSSASVTVSNTDHSQHGQSQSLRGLIASFSGLSIEPTAPEVEGLPQPPCPIADLPEEILVHILRDVALADVGDFVRLTQVCKRLAYLVATEDQIWRRICLGPEFGFGGMHYQWQQGVSWEPLDGDVILGEAPLSPEVRARQQQTESRATTNTMLPAVYSSSWQRMFRLRPRIRFNGCYISTVNYIRAGQASSHQVTWNSPIHIITYFRYLRFFRDGTVISLLTTAEPGDVVHHVTKEVLEMHKGGAMAHLPSIVMQSAFRGRWRLSSAAENPEAALADVEGDLFIETEGVSKYLYRLDLSMRSAGKGARNNKLVWRGFYSYNKLTDDWSQFALKNDKPFFFSRVKSYGMGGHI